MKSQLLLLFLIFGTLAVYSQDATNLVSDTKLASDPVSCTPGQRYFNTTLVSERLCTAPDTWGSLGGGSGNLSGSGVPSNALCTQAGLGYVNSLNGDFYTCPTAAGAWVLVSAGASPAAFNQITAGTNAGNTLTVGNSSILTFTGSGIVNANRINSVALSSLSTGLLKNATGTGIPSIALAGTDYQVPGNYITALTGDLTAAGPGTAAGTLKNTGTPGTYTKVTFDAQGRETAGFTAACADLSNASASCSIDATNGSNILSGSVALARIASIANNTLLGNNAGGFATPIALSAAQVTALLNPFSTALQGLVPASGGGTVNFLRADGTFAAPPGLASIAADNLLANFTASSAVPVANAVPACANDGAHALVFVAHVLTCEAISVSGSGTVVSGVATHIPIYAASTAAVSSDALFTDDGTTLTYTGASGITSTHGFTAPPDGVHPADYQLYGNTTLPGLSTNLVNLIGPSSATFTAYGLQFSGTGPAAAGVMLVGAPTSAVSQVTYGTLTGNTAKLVSWSGAITTGHCPQLDASGNLVDSGSSNCGGGGSISWNVIGNAAGNLTLANGTNTTEFDQTSAASWKWANTTVAVVGTSQSSPIASWCGTAFHASASVADCLTMQDIPGAGNDAAITFAVGHTGTSTGIVTTTFPGPVQSTADATHPGDVQLVGNTTVPPLGSNLFNLIGPNAATFTAYGLQFSATGPAAAGVMLVGTPSSAISQVTYGLVPAADLVNAGVFTGDATSTFPAITIGVGAISLAKMANLAANSIIGNNTGAPATPLALTGAQVTAMLGPCSTTLQGTVPATGGGTTNFLRADCTFAAPPGSGSGVTFVNHGASTVSSGSVALTATATGEDFWELDVTTTNITTFTITGQTNPSRQTIKLCQPAGGTFTTVNPTGYTLVFATSADGASSPCTLNTLDWNGTVATSIPAGVNLGPSQAPETAAPSVNPLSAVADEWVDSTLHNLEILASTGLLTGTVQESQGLATMAALSTGVNSQSGVSYTVIATDGNKLLTFNNGSAVAVTLPQATTTGFKTGALFTMFNRGAGTVTVTPTTSTINGAATITLAQNQGAEIVSDGTNYSAWVSQAGGTITASGPPAIHQLPIWTTATNLTGIAVPASGTLLTGIAASDPSWSATPTLGVDNTTAGTLTLANGGAVAHTILAAGGVTQTIAGFGTLPVTGHAIGVTVSGSAITLNDSSVPEAQILFANSPTNGALLVGAGTQTPTTASGTTVINGGTNVIAGALAANTRLLITANVTQNTAAIAITQNFVTIECTAGVKITFATSTVDGFDISGNDDRITGCIIDGNSAQTKPAINITGNRTTIENNTFQNMGVTSPATANVYINVGAGHVIRKNYWPSITDSIILVTNLTDSTTVKDILITQNQIDAFNPGAAVLTGINALHGANSTRMVAHVTVTQNRMYCQGANATCMGQDFDISGSGDGLAQGSIWADNHIILTAATAEMMHVFGQRHGTVHHNLFDAQGFVVNRMLSLGDVYYDAIDHNVFLDSGFASTAVLELNDDGRCVVEGNVIDGVGSGAFGIYMISTSGVNADSILSGNVIDLNTFFTNTTAVGIRIESNSVSFNTTGKQIINNHVLGSSLASQIGIALVNTTGTFSTSYISQNQIENVATGISIGAGVVSSKIGDNYFAGVTTEYVDSNVTAPLTHYAPQCHTYTLSVATTNFTVTQDGGPVTNTAVGGTSTQNINLFTLCPLCVVTGITLKTNTVWSATGLTSMGTTVGDSVGGATTYTSSSYNMFSAVSNTNFQDTSLFKHASQAGSNVQAALTANQNMNANQLAGSTDYRVCWQAQ